MLEGYDGASVMPGVFGGLQALLKENAPKVYNAHCPAYS